MTIDEYPILLTRSGLTRPLELSIHRIQNLRPFLVNGLDLVLVHGAFVMIVASLEVALSDVMKAILVGIPQKIDKTEFSYQKDSFFNNIFNLVEITAERIAIKNSYKSFSEQLTHLLKLLDLDKETAKLIAYIPRIREISSARNLLLHNDCVVNDIYLESAGELVRCASIGTKLTVDLRYVQESVDQVLEFEITMLGMIETKYRDYTKIASLRRLWEFLFNSPIMAFDDFWICDTAHDVIRGMKRHPKEELSLANSELMLLSLWRAHFNLYEKDLKYLHMPSLDRQHQEKALFLMSVARKYEFE